VVFPAVELAPGHGLRRQQLGPRGATGNIDRRTKFTAGKAARLPFHPQARGAGQFGLHLAFRENGADGGMHVHAANLLSIPRSQLGMSQADSHPRPTPMQLAAMSKISP